MGYNPSDSIVRCDIFKPSGKWHDSIAIDMAKWYNNKDVHLAVYKAYKAAGRTLYKGWRLVVTEPYHQFARPVLVGTGLYNCQFLEGIYEMSVSD